MGRLAAAGADPARQPGARGCAAAHAAVPARGQAQPSRDPALEPVDRHRAAVPRQLAVRDLLAVQRARLRDGRVARAGADRRAEAVDGGVRDVPAGPRAGYALAGRAAGRSRLRLQPVDGHVGLLSARERVGACAVGALRGRGGPAPPDVAPRGAAGGRARRPVPVRSPRIQLPPAGGRRRLGRAALAQEPGAASRRRPAGAQRALGRGARGARAAPGGGTRAALRRPRAARGRGAQHLHAAQVRARRDVARSTGASRPRRRSSSSCSLAPSTPARCR